MRGRRGRGHPDEPGAHGLGRLLREQKLGDLEGIAEPVLGFAVRGDATEQLEDVRFSTVAHRPAFGLYVWPTAWSVGWRSPRGPAELRLRTVARRTVFNFRVAGFAMAVVAGIWTDAGVVVPVYGLAELLVVPRYLRRLAR